MNSGIKKGGRAYGYVRVSTRAQAEDGESLGVQERMLEGFAMMHGRPLERVFIERAVSGGSPFAKRLAAREALDVMERGDTLIIVKLDRGFRDAGDMLDTIRMFRDQGMSLRKISDALQAAGHKLSHVGVADVLRGETGAPERIG